MRERESSSAGSEGWNGEEGEAVLLKQDRQKVVFFLHVAISLSLE